MPDYEMKIIVNGSSVKQYRHEGETFIEGRKGSNFSIKVKNNTGHRVKAVLTVDGLSAIDGQEGTVDGGGYVISAYDSITVPGWLVDSQSVAAFTFERSEESYAAKLGKPKNRGVIACALWREKEPEDSIYKYVPVAVPYVRPSGSHPHRPWWVQAGTICYSGDAGSLKSACLGDTTDGSNSGKGPVLSRSDVQVPLSRSPIGDIGVGFGYQTDFATRDVDFEPKSSTPDAIIAVHYDTRDGLERRGVKLRKEVDVAQPNPFPATPRFCKPPKGWKCD